MNQPYSAASRPSQLRACVPGAAPGFATRYPEFDRLSLRFPYRSRELIDLALRIPADHILGAHGEKRLFLGAVEGRENYTLHRRTGLLNQYFLTSFLDAPCFEWRDIIADSTDQWSGYVSQDAVTRILGSDRPRPGECLLLWRLVCFSLWFHSLEAMDASSW